MFWEGFGVTFAHANGRCTNHRHFFQRFSFQPALLLVRTGFALTTVVFSNAFRFTLAYDARLLRQLLCFGVPVLAFPLVFSLCAALFTLFGPAGGQWNVFPILASSMEVLGSPWLVRTDFALSHGRLFERLTFHPAA